jgi:hypothetical protein
MTWPERQQGSKTGTSARETLMRSPNCLFRQKPWFDRSEILMAVGASLLASSVLLLLVPSVGTVFVGVLTGVLLVARALVLRLRQRKATQLRLTLPTPGSCIRFPDRYELVLVIVVILSYGAIAAVLRSVKAPGVLIRFVPLVSFAAGLVAKKYIQGAVARGTDYFREHLGRSETRTARTLRGETR